MKLTVHHVFEDASTCSDHPLAFDKSLLDGAETLLSGGECDQSGGWQQDIDHSGHSYCESSSFALARLKDGRYFYVTESSDSSGHG
jgi:hypothetical protein